MMRTITTFLIALLCAGAAEAGLLDRLTGDRDAQLAALREADTARHALNAAAWPLLTNAALVERCDGGRGTYGFTINGVEGIDIPRSADYAAMGTAPRAVLAVQRGSPAEQAGLRVGDVIIRIDGKRLRDSAKGDNVLNQRLADARDDARVIELHIERDGAAHALTITPTVACDFEAIVGASFGLAGSHSLPRKLRNRAFTVDMAVFRLLADDAPALQAVIIHELAHHLEGHVRARGLAVGVARGVDMALGAVAGFGTGGALATAGGIAFKASEEREADAAALELCGHLGLDPAVYTHVVQRLGTERPDLLASFVGAHPIDSERLSALPGGEG